MVAPEARRVQGNYASPAQILEAVYAIVGPRYLWGSDHPFMSWCDDEFAGVFDYEEEAAVLREVPEAIRTSMTQTAPRQWLYGE